MAVNFKLLRTNAGSKRPTAAQLELGELALNYDQGTAGLFFEDTAGAVRKIGPIEVSGTAPNASPAGSSGNSLGEMWLDTSVTPKILKAWDGSAWQNVSTVVAGTDTGVVYNDNGVLASDGNFVYDSTNEVLTVASIDATLALSTANDITIVDNSAVALEIKEGTNAYMTFDTTDTAEEIVAHKDLVQTPSSSVTPTNNGELMVEATSNTTLTFKLKGTDGTVRTGTITLS